MTDCPEIVGGAKVLAYVLLEPELRNFNEQHRVWITGMTICQYKNMPGFEDEDGFYLFECDSEWNSLTDTWHESFEQAQKQGEYWLKAKIDWISR